MMKLSAQPGMPVLDNEERAGSLVDPSTGASRRAAPRGSPLATLPSTSTCNSPHLGSKRRAASSEGRLQSTPRRKLDVLQASTEIKRAGASPRQQQGDQKIIADNRKILGLTVARAQQLLDSSGVGVFGGGDVEIQLTDRLHSELFNVWSSHHHEEVVSEEDSEDEFAGSRMHSGGAQCQLP